MLYYHSAGGASIFDASLLSPSPVQSGERWNVVEAEAPEVPKDYKPIASSILPCTVHDFYNRVISGNTDYLQTEHSKASG